MTYAIIDYKAFSASDAFIDDEALFASKPEYMLSVLDSLSDDSRDLYLRYMRLSERINGTDLVGKSKLDPRVKKSKLTLVRNDIPSLEVLQQAVIAAVRLAQKGEGDLKKLVEHISAFKYANDVDFILNATEAHREALFDLVRNAGIAIEPYRQLAAAGALKHEHGGASLNAPLLFTTAFTSSAARAGASALKSTPQAR